MKDVLIEPTFASWQAAARELLHQHLSPREVIWHDSSAHQESLFSTLQTQIGQSRTQHIENPAFRVPKRFVDVARRVSRHRDPKKWALLYSVLWRVLHENRNLLSIRLDNEVSQLRQLNWEVGADAHRMKALLRFRRVRQNGEDVYIAWYKPDHLVVPLVVSHFTDKFASMRWAILTPDCCAHWDGVSVKFSKGVDQKSAPQDDALEELWKTFYESTFNPARLSMKTMKSEMPVRFWKTLPEAEVIGRVVSEAPNRVQEMLAREKGKGKRGL